MSKRVFRFTAEVFGDANSGFVMPIYDEYTNLVGGCTVLRGNVLQCFVGGSDFPAALQVSSEASFFLTSRFDQRGQVTHCILSERPVGPDSIKVSMAEEETLTDKILEVQNVQT